MYKKCYGRVCPYRNNRGARMPKKLLIWALIAFAAFYLFTQPKNAGDNTQKAFGAVGDLFNSVITFLTALFT